MSHHLTQVMKSLNYYPTALKRDIFADERHILMEMDMSRNFVHLMGKCTLKSSTMLYGEETKKAPTQEGEREITMDDFTYAFYKESKDLPDEKKKMLLDMARFMKSDIEKGKG